MNGVALAASSTIIKTRCAKRCNVLDELCKNLQLRFMDAYIPIANNRKGLPYTGQKHWQEIRRGAMWNSTAVHDRGTLFGLKQNGRTESILMSLPPTVRFEYGYQPVAGSEEDKLLQACLHEEWIANC